MRQTMSETLHREEEKQMCTKYLWCLYALRTTAGRTRTLAQTLCAVMLFTCFLCKLVLNPIVHCGSQSTQNEKPRNFPASSVCVCVCVYGYVDTPIVPLSLTIQSPHKSNSRRTTKTQSETEQQTTSRHEGLERCSQFSRRHWSF